jgi:hypothetical protein
MWTIQLAFLHVVCRMFLSFLTLCNTYNCHTVSPSDLLHPSPARHFKTFQVQWHALNNGSTVAFFLFCRWLCSSNGVWHQPSMMRMTMTTTCPVSLSVASVSNIVVRWY